MKTVNIVILDCVWCYTWFHSKITISGDSTVLGTHGEVRQEQRAGELKAGTGRVTWWLIKTGIVTSAAGQ